MTLSGVSLVAGDAIDAFLASHLRHATSEHALARLLLRLQATLFPGGTWYSFGGGTAAAADTSVQQQQQQQGSGDGSRRGSVSGAAAAAPGVRWRPPPAMDPVSYLEPAARPPDAEEVAERVGAGVRPRPVCIAAPTGACAHANNIAVMVLICHITRTRAVLHTPKRAALPPLPAPQRAPSPRHTCAVHSLPYTVPQVRTWLLSRPLPQGVGALVGSRAYGRALVEVWGLLQSRTFLLQLAYSLLHTVLGRVFPEMQHRLRRLQPSMMAGEGQGQGEREGQRGQKGQREGALRGGGGGAAVGVGPPATRPEAGSAGLA